MTIVTTLWIKRIEHGKWNRGRNGLHQLGQPAAPSVLFPVFNPPYPQGKLIALRTAKVYGAKGKFVQSTHR